MPRRKNLIPSYLRHKPSGQARVSINGQTIYLGKYGSKESKERYHRLLAEFCVLRTMLAAFRGLTGGVMSLLVTLR